MKFLKLENSKLTVLVDDSNFERLSKFKWYDCKKVIQHVKAGKHTSIANEILKTNGVEYDHIDTNYLNCIESNLRVCTHQQNCFNRRKQFGNYSSMYKGVSYYRRNGKWRVTIFVNKKQINLGFYASEIKAARAYDKAALEFFKEFAWLNNV